MLAPEVPSRFWMTNWILKRENFRLSQLSQPAISAAQDLPSGFLLAMPVLAAEVQGSQGGVVQFRAFNAGEELKAFLFLGFFVGLVPLFVRDLSPWRTNNKWMLVMEMMYNSKCIAYSIVNRKGIMLITLFEALWLCKQPCCFPDCSAIRELVPTIVAWKSRARWLAMTPSTTGLHPGRPH